MLAREATKADIQAVRDRLREAKEQRQLDIQINQAIALVNRNHSLKKHLFQGHELDISHMAKELGDVAWYLAVSANAIGYDLETIMQMNVDKLKARYPDGFDAEHSLHRNRDDI